MTAKVDACGCSAGGREAGSRGREPGRRQLLFLADRAALRGAESHSGHFSNTCAVRKILIHDVGDN